jgi:hypothetical protein
VPCKQDKGRTGKDNNTSQVSDIYPDAVSEEFGDIYPDTVSEEFGDIYPDAVSEEFGDIYPVILTAVEARDIWISDSDYLSGNWRHLFRNSAFSYW